MLCVVAVFAIGGGGGDVLGGGDGLLSLVLDDNLVLVIGLDEVPGRLLAVGLGGLAEVLVVLLGVDREALHSVLERRPLDEFFVEEVVRGVAHVED